MQYNIRVYKNTMLIQNILIVTSDYLMFMKAVFDITPNYTLGLILKGNISLYRFSVNCLS